MRDNRKCFLEQSINSRASGSTETPPTTRWVTAKECVDEGFNIAAEYEGSASLFRGILSTGKGKIGPLVAAATIITATAKLSTILEAFVKISRALVGLTAEDAREDVEPLRRKPIFPILQKRGNKDTLAFLNRKNQPWFIADRHHLRDSFFGRAELLAFAPEDLELIESLLKVLELDSRKAFKASQQ